MKHLKVTVDMPVDPAPAASTSRQPYQDVDVLRSSDGLKAVISQRRANGVFTFGVFKVYERDGAEHQTGFIPASLAESYKRMVDIAVARIAEIRASGQYPFPIT